MHQKYLYLTSNDEVRNVTAMRVLNTSSVKRVQYLIKLQEPHTASKLSRSIHRGLEKSQ